MKENTRKTLRIFWRYVWTYKVSGFFTVIGIIGAASLNVVIPIYFKRFFDILAQAQVREAVVGQLVHILFTIALVEMLNWGFWRLATFYVSYFQASIMADLSDMCFRYLHKHSFAYFNDNFVGGLVKKVGRFTRAFEGLTDKLFFNILQLTVNIGIIIFVLATKSTMLAIVLSIWILLFFIVNLIFTNFKMKYDLAKSEADSAATGILADTITNHTNVKLFGGYGREIKHFAKAIGKLKNLRWFTWNLGNIYEAAQHLLTIVLEIGIFYIAVQLWKDGRLTIGDFVLIQSYVLIVLMKTWDFGRVVRGVYEDLADAEEMTVVLNEPHGIIDTKNATDLRVSKGEIEFKQVDFFYHETRPILRNFNLTISPREKIALVGPSGGGKSTIIKLLLRMYDITAGKILIDGQKVDHVKMESLWQNVSMVPQDPILFHRTLLENIRYGKPDATEADVIKAAKLAHCHEFIKFFPEGYNTYVGERGVKLSGGERQRVAIARAILHNAPILILDEATSSLDSESEQLIQKALDVLIKGKTVIVVAHRLSTIMKMDRIIVIKDGAVVETGSHQELIQKQNGLYQKLWQVQAGGFIG